MKFFLPILFLAGAVGLFFWFIDPAYARIKELRVQEAEFDQALTRARELQEVRDELIQRYNGFPSEDIARLEKLLPDHIDNVRLIIDLDSIASRYGMRVRNVAIESSQNHSIEGAVGPDESTYESVVISFSVAGPYDTFRGFLTDLERSLRLVDVTKLSFSATPSGIYEYNISVKTYWLKP
ncbi:hypothetical protein A2841_02880 [Candidatus Kaiserbacteria bacterium RIFCSPHIGHO2_01_FULL_48_10]|uniref:Pilus assembly protein PilO n=1 Tax=Candidatus Kaiserbacteria bacterium RIFCSPHIGHO2_01_FULL_48_10 TaxID=1798476 RepID=A0A1F6C5X8_9BACT|nr:MAG: hypothetical protein A2841_02880 [Candidatus Kaiserbacteria bacterium RIFCSPHIGHO2_01_FULL_48_10]